MRKGTTTKRSGKETSVDDFRSKVRKWIIKASAKGFRKNEQREIQRYLDHLVDYDFDEIGKMEGEPIRIFVNEKTRRIDVKSSSDWKVGLTKMFPDGSG